MSDCVAKTHNSETSVKAPECLLKQQICHHCTNCHGDKVRSQTYWYYQCMSVCSLPFTATSRKNWVEGWLHLFRMVREHAGIQIIFLFPGSPSHLFLSNILSVLSWLWISLQPVALSYLLMLVMLLSLSLVVCYIYDIFVYISLI